MESESHRWTQQLHPDVEPSRPEKDLEDMDAAIQRDLNDPLEDHPCELWQEATKPSLANRIAQLLADAPVTMRLGDFANLFRDSPQADATSALLIDLDRQQLPPGEALSAMAMFAAEHDALNIIAPLVAVIAVRALESSSLGRMSIDRLGELIESLTEASRSLAMANGAETLRIIPRILHVIHHHAERNHVSADEIPSAVQRISQQVVSNPRVIDRLMAQQGFREERDCSRPGVSSGSKKVQRLVIDRTAELTIRYLD